MRPGRSDRAQRLLPPRPDAHRNASHGGKIACCGTCLDVRGIRDEMLVDAATRSTLGELTGWTIDADKVLVF